MSDHPLVRHARDRGPIAPGEYRAVVLESDDRITLHDFDSFAEARAYAYDCASETDRTVVSDSGGISTADHASFDEALAAAERGELAIVVDWKKQIEKKLRATVIIQHDPRDIGKLPAFPAAAK